MQTDNRQQGDQVVREPNDLALQHASRVAAALFRRAKAECLSPPPSLTSPMSSVLLTEDEGVFWLQGLLFHDHPLLDKEQHAMTVKFFAYLAAAWAVIDVASAYVADRCAACGATHRSYTQPCPHCRARPVLYRDNPFRRPAVCTALHLRDSTFHYGWFAEAQFYGDGQTVSWLDGQAGEPRMLGPIIGRFEAPWAIDGWIRPHMILNLPALAQFLGYRVDSRVTAAARKVEADAPPDFEFLRIDPRRMKSVIRRVALENLIT